MRADIELRNFIARLGRFRRATKSKLALPHSPHPQPLAVSFKKRYATTIRGNGKNIILDKNLERNALRANDWYYQHSWFSKYFCDKLKRKTMNIIYKLYSSIEEILLEKYLVEFYFYTGVLDKNKLEAYNKKHGTMYLGEFKCYLPILFMVKNYDELEYLVTIMNGELYREYKCEPIRTNISDKILTEEMLNYKIEISKSKLKNGNTGILNLDTFTPIPTDKNLEIKYKIKKERYKFQTLKSGPELLRHKLEYVIQFCKTTTEE